MCLKCTCAPRNEIICFAFPKRGKFVVAPFLGRHGVKFRGCLSATELASVESIWPSPVAKSPCLLQGRLVFVISPLVLSTFAVRTRLNGVTYG